MIGAVTRRVGRPAWEGAVSVEPSVELRRALELASRAYRGPQLYQKTADSLIVCSISM
jgi:hypothetical protein